MPDIQPDYLSTQAPAQQPNYLSALAQGLRTAGMGLSSNAFQAGTTADLQTQHLKAQHDQLVTGVMVKALESGALAPDVSQKVQQILVAKGYPPVGPSVATQQNQLENLEKQRVTQQTQESDTEIDAATKAYHVQKDYQNKLEEERRRAEAEQKARERADDPNKYADETEMGPPNDVKIHVLATDQGLIDTHRIYSGLLQSSNAMTRKRALEELSKVKTIVSEKTEYLQLMHARDSLPEGDPGRADIQQRMDKMNADPAHSQMTERAMDKLKQYELKDRAFKRGQGPALTEAEELDAATARSEVEKIQPMWDSANNRLVMGQPMTVPPGITVGKSGGYHGQAPVNKEYELSQGGGQKPLDAGTEAKFTSLGDSRALLNNAIGGFKDGYGGWKNETFGRAMNELGRKGIAPSLTDQAQFWEQYDQYFSGVTLATGGKALTPTELEQMRRWRITPDQSDDVIRHNLQRQKEVLEGAIARQLEAARVSGQNEDQAKALVGEKPPPAPATAPPSTSGDDPADVQADLKRMEDEMRRRREAK